MAILYSSFSNTQTNAVGDLAVTINTTGTNLIVAVPNYLTASNINISSPSLTWTCICGNDSGTASGGIWAAWSNSTLNLETITAFHTDTEASSISGLLTIFVITGSRNGSSDITKCFGISYELSAGGTQNLFLSQNSTLNSLFIGAYYTNTGTWSNSSFNQPGTVIEITANNNHLCSLTSHGTGNTLSVGQNQTGTTVTILKLTEILPNYSIYNNSFSESVSANFSVPSVGNPIPAFE